MVVQRSKALTYFLICFSVAVGVQAQSKKELKAEVLQLKNTIAKKNQQLLFYADSLGKLKNQNTDLKLHLLTLQDSLAEVLQTQKMVQKNLVLDSLSQVEIDSLVQKHKRIYAKNSAYPEIRREQQQFFERNTLNNCLMFDSYQTLFVETSVLEYGLFPTTAIFSGFLKTQFVPEFGDVVYNVQAVSGEYVKEGNVLTLIITQVDFAETNIQILHNLKMPYNSKITYKQPLGATLFYKEVPIEQKDPSECD